jgi:hypothetical protein
MTQQITLIKDKILSDNYFTINCGRSNNPITDI